MANPEHLELLRQGAEVWNAWRAKNPSVPLDLRGANLGGRNLNGVDLSKTVLAGANLGWATIETDARGANLQGANLTGASLHYANLSEADLSGAVLAGASLLGTDLRGANLTGCRVYGVSVWNAQISKETVQQNLVITPDRPELTVDNIEVAQFVYLLLHNEKIRDVIDTIGRKGVLLLGRFTEGRIGVLERLREELRKLDYVPIVFNFDKPTTKDFTETVRLLAGLSKFVIADITNPRSSPLELQATIPEIMVPFQPIIQQGEESFAMLADLQRKHDWVFKTIRYSSLDRLIETMDDEIIKPAEAKSKQLVGRRAELIEDREV